MTPLEVVLARVDGARRCGSGFIGRCPAHDDKRPSLSLRETADGKLLVHCFAGCSAAEIVAALGLTMRVLFSERSAR